LSGQALELLELALVKLEPSDAPKLTHCFASYLCQSERYELDAGSHTIGDAGDDERITRDGDVGGGRPSVAGWLVVAWVSDGEAARLHIRTNSRTVTMPMVLRIVIDTVTSGSAAKGKIIIRSIGAMLRTAVVTSVACLIPTSLTRRLETRR
jgi:hypothetical protein